MIGLAAFAAMALAPGCQGGLCNARALDPWFAKLQRAAAPGGRQGKPLHILQIGDSHTAGDAITGAWRDQMQARYGSGGRGVMPPGRPYNGFLSYGATASMSPGWTVASGFGANWGGGGTPLGLSGFSLTSSTPGSTIGLVADSTEQFNRFTVCALARPGAGALSIRVGGTTERMNLSSITQRPECKTIRTPGLSEDAMVTLEQGSATVTSIASFRDGQGGVAISNLGIVGSQLVHFGRTDDQVLGEELREYDPDLIVVAFGTNEGFAARFTPFEYEVVLRSQIGRIRRLAGNVPILLLGAPDAASRRAEMRINAPGYSVAECGATPALAQAAPAPAPARPAYDPIGAIVAALRGDLTTETPQQPAVDPPPTPAPAATASGGLFAPAALKAVRDVQRRVASSLGVAFWDWDARMGGACTSVAWVRQSPPLMRGDYVHYTKAGGHEIATRLQADLDRAAAAR
ncbi:GDSL-type esterase/lipase family protein [Sphingomonas naphthae]|uniref:GDSL-type esterase/lipase family protein n=1 Tax=Sphingomonas naphthae TaxID=1813468 RepID=A0ABY7TRN7_9SPHN|nr:GDSL-type esterase/lipase family protein [Sphingomonas naphthae]WCT75356.1 GDSL-type esterase/lipase family protein [Sphingomonas naphthae]